MGFARTNCGVGTPDDVAGKRKQSTWVWLRCEYPVVARGLASILSGVAEVRHERLKGEAAPPYCTIVCYDGQDLTEKIRDVREAAPESPLLVVGLLNEAKCARIALRSGASGFIHVGMAPAQIRRALSLACEGETVVPRDLVADLVKQEEEEGIDPLILTPRQREILDLVAEGLTNGQIAQRLFLSEYTIKQHLRAAYKILGVRNRVEAARVFRRSQSTGWGKPRYEPRG